MSQDLTLDSTVVTAFGNNMRLRPQQLQSRLVSTVMSDLGYSDAGEMFTSEFQGTSEPTERTGRAPKSPEGFVEEERRVAAFKALDDGKWIDTIDKANKLADPTNGTVQAMIAGKERSRDRAIYQAALGPVRSGKTGETSTPFSAGQIIAVNDIKYYRGKADQVAAPAVVPFPLTPSKLRAAASLLDEGELQGERFIICCSDDIQNMLTSVEVTSTDFTAIQALMNGTVDAFMGFKFVRCPASLFNVPTANVRDLVAYIKPAIEYKSTDLEIATITRRADRSFTPYAYYMYRHGCLRTFDTGVVNIKAAF